MSEIKKMQPKVRFKEFAGENAEAWEQRKLGEMLEERNEQIPENDEYPLMSFVQGAGVTPKGDRYDRSFLVKNDDKKYKKTELGDFIYSSNNLETGSIGFNRTGNAVISPVYSIFSSKDALESQFIGILSTRKDFIAKMVRFRQGVVYGQWRIHEKDFLNIKINVPKHEEQKKIIDFFVNIDNLIALHQRELDNTKQLKSTMLSKMFPKDGSDIPEFRFAGFTDPWEQRKLNDVCDSFEYGLNAAAKPYDGKNKYVRITDIDDESRRFLDTNLTSPDTDLNGADNYLLKNGDILFARTGASVGKSYIYRENDGLVYYAGFLIRARVKPEYDPEFVFHNTLTSKYDKYIKVTSQRSGQPGVNAQEYASFSINVPNQEEQHKIGRFFNNIDNLIALHQRELETYQTLKQTMLDKMFV